MPGKDFEQQVREQFSPWDQQPSEKVWNRLEAALLQQKRRRRFAYLFLVAGLLAGALWWGNAYRQSSTGQLPVTVTSPLPATDGAGSATSTNGAGSIKSTDGANSSTSAGGAGSGRSTGDQPVAGATNPGLGDQPAGKPTTDPSLSAPLAGKATANQPISEHTNTAAQKAKPVKGDGVASIPVTADTRTAPTTRQKQPEQGAREPKPTKQQAGQTKTVDPETTGVSAQPDPSQNNPTASRAVALATIDPARRSLAFVLPATDNRKTEVAPDLAAPAGEAITLKPSAKRGLVLGVSAGIGRSGYGSGFSLTTEKAADQVSSPGGSGAPATPVPYSYRQDPAWGGEIGAWLRWSMSPRWSLQAGLAYQQWQTVTPVGAVSSGSRNFSNGADLVTTPTSYTSGRQGEYTNRYQLLSMPVNLEWQVNAGKKLPLIWTLGLVPGMLLSSNALVGQGDTVLYHHPDNQQRMQLGLRSSLMFRIMPKRERPIDIGPVFQYQLNRVFISSLPEEGHLHYLGLEARMPILFLRRAQR